MLWLGRETHLPQFTRVNLRWAGSGEARGVLFIGDRCFDGDTLTGRGRAWLSTFECLVALFGAWICSSVSKTSDMRGLCFGSWLKHCTATVAAANAAFCGYWPSSLMSIIRNNFRLSPMYGFAQSTRFCSTPTFVLSTARRPESNSSNTTPKLYTSLFVVNRPVSYKYMNLLIVRTQKNRRGNMKISEHLQLIFRNWWILK